MIKTGRPQRGPTDRSEGRPAQARATSRAPTAAPSRPARYPLVEEPSFRPPRAVRTGVRLRRRPAPLARSLIPASSHAPGRRPRGAWIPGAAARSPRRVVRRRPREHRRAGQPAAIDRRSERKLRRAHAAWIRRAGYGASLTSKGPSSPILTEGLLRLRLRANQRFGTPPRVSRVSDVLGDHLGETITGLLRSKNSVSPTLSLFISSICACNSGGISLRSPSRASASEVKYMTMV